MQVLAFVDDLYELFEQDDLGAFSRRMPQDPAPFDQARVEGLIP